LEIINLKGEKDEMQEEIINVLKNNRKPLSRREIAGLLKESENKISMRIKRLIEIGEVEYIEIPRKLAMKMYHCYRRMRIYYAI